MSYSETSCLSKGFIRDVAVEMRFKKTVMFLQLRQFAHLLRCIFEILQTKSSLTTGQKKANNNKRNSDKNNQIAGNVMQDLWDKISKSEDSTLNLNFYFIFF